MNGEAVKASKPRDYSFDNLKGILIFLVVFGHLLVQGKQFDVCNILYRCIYLFHMPLFVLISGYFSKKAAKSFSYSVKTALILYILFVIIFKAVECVVDPSLLGNTSHLLTNVPFVHWYLLCLFYWRLITPILAKISEKKIPVLPFLVIAGILAGAFLDTNKFSAARAITFLPYYWLGFSLSAERVGQLRKHSKWIYLGVLAAVFGCALWIFLTVKASYASIFQMKDTYEAAGLEPLSGALVRLALYAAASVVCICLIAAMPNRKCFLSKIGGNTLPVYIWHSYIIYFVVRKFKVLDGIIAKLPAAGALAFLFGCAAVLTVLLSLPPFTTLADGINRLAGAIFDLLAKPFSKTKNAKAE